MPGCQVRTILGSMPSLYRTDYIPGTKTVSKKVQRQNSLKRRSRDIQKKRLSSLAEAIIMQSLDDLWSKTQKNTSIAFFTGEGFDICARVAGMRIIDRIALFALLRRLDRGIFRSRHAKKVRTAIKND